MMPELIHPSLFRIVVPLPGSPLKEINSYVLTAPDRNLVIDTGMNRPECREALVGGLEDLGVDTWEEWEVDPGVNEVKGRRQVRLHGDRQGRPRGCSCP